MAKRRRDIRGPSSITVPPRPTSCDPPRLPTAGGSSSPPADLCPQHSPGSSWATRNRRVELRPKCDRSDDEAVDSDWMVLLPAHVPTPSKGDPRGRSTPRPRRRWWRWFLPPAAETLVRSTPGRPNWSCRRCEAQAAGGCAEHRVRTRSDPDWAGAAPRRPRTRCGRRPGGVTFPGTGAFLQTTRAVLISSSHSPRFRSIGDPDQSPVASRGLALLGWMLVLGCDADTGLLAEKAECSRSQATLPGGVAPWSRVEIDDGSACVAFTGMTGIDGLTIACPDGHLERFAVDGAEVHWLPGGRRTLVQRSSQGSLRLIGVGEGIRDSFAHGVCRALIDRESGTLIAVEACDGDGVGQLALWSVEALLSGRTAPFLRIPRGFAAGMNLEKSGQARRLLVPKFRAPCACDPLGVVASLLLVDLPAGSVSERTDVEAAAFYGTLGAGILSAGDSTCGCGLTGLSLWGAGPSVRVSELASRDYRIARPGIGGLQLFEEDDWAEELAFPLLAMDATRSRIRLIDASGAKEWDGHLIWSTRDKSGALRVVYTPDLHRIAQLYSGTPEEAADLGVSQGLRVPRFHRTTTLLVPTIRAVRMFPVLIAGDGVVTYPWPGYDAVLPLDSYGDTTFVLARANFEDRFYLEEMTPSGAKRIAEGPANPNAWERFAIARTNSCGALIYGNDEASTIEWSPLEPDWR